jgi:hypothetical protein
MKPITADSRLGIVLLALRAGSMTADQLSERWPTGHAVSDAVRAGLVEVVGGGYRLTEAGRVAVPLRNPLAAPGMVRPITESMENAMREPKLSRQQVLAVVKEAGATGISKADIVAKLDHLAPENAITSHLVILKKDGEIDNPSRGIWVASDAGQVPARKVVEKAGSKALHATREAVLHWLEKRSEGVAAVPFAIAHGIGCTEDSTRAVLAGLFASLKVDREAVGNDFAYFLAKPKADLSEKAAPAVVEPAPAESIPKHVIKPGTYREVTAEIEQAGAASELETTVSQHPAAEQISPTVEYPVVEDTHLADPDEVEFAVFSSGGMDIYCGESTVTLSKPVLIKLRRFLGLFQEAA